MGPPRSQKCLKEQARNLSNLLIVVQQASHTGLHILSRVCNDIPCALPVGGASGPSLEMQIVSVASRHYMEWMHLAEAPGSGGPMAFRACLQGPLEVR